MIARLDGTLVSKDLGQAIIDCAGVGYAVAMSLSGLGRLPAAGQRAQVWVHTSLSQDALRLFGFVDLAERDAFLVLLTTPGVGPRLALTVLSALSPAELALAVREGNRAQLCAIGGVGKKKAERLLVELRDRLPEVQPDAPGGRSLRADLHSALTNLGFAAAVAERIATEVLEAHPGQTDLTALLRHALRASSG